MGCSTVIKVLHVALLAVVTFVNCDHILNMTSSTPVIYNFTTISQTVNCLIDIKDLSHRQMGGVITLEFDLTDNINPFFPSPSLNTNDQLYCTDNHLLRQLRSKIVHLLNNSTINPQKVSSRRRRRLSSVAAVELSVKEEDILMISVQPQTFNNILRVPLLVQSQIKDVIIPGERIKIAVDSSTDQLLTNQMKGCMYETSYVGFPADIRVDITSGDEHRRGFGSYGGVKHFLFMILMISFLVCIILLVFCAIHLLNKRRRHHIKHPLPACSSSSSTTPANTDYLGGRDGGGNNGIVLPRDVNSQSLLCVSSEEEESRRGVEGGAGGEYEVPYIEDRYGWIIPLDQLLPEELLSFDPSDLQSCSLLTDSQQISYT